MPCAALLLTGGASRRMGRDKASLPAPGRAGVSLAEHIAGLLSTCAAPVLEVGPGRSGATAIAESPPLGGPLRAVAAGYGALRAMGWRGPVLVVATDLPLLTGPLLCWLARHPSGSSVVPVAAGRVQPLCARYSPADLDLAAALVRDGRRAMSDLLALSAPLLVDEEVWAGPAGDPRALDDVDTPEDLRRLSRRTWP